MRYFTSDLHVGDATLTRLRGYGDDVAAHDALVAGALARLLPDDELWLLGDLCEPSIEAITELRKMIPCSKVHVVIGNHDSRSAFLTSGLFDSVEHYDQVGNAVTDGYEFVMSHYPMLHWDGKLKGSYMLHGHIHSLPAGGYPGSEPPCPKAEDGIGGFFIPGVNESNRECGEKRFDVGLDANHFRLVSADDIVAFFAGV